MTHPHLLQVCVAGFCNRCCFTPNRAVFHRSQFSHEPLPLLPFRWLYIDIASLSHVPVVFFSLCGLLISSGWHVHTPCARVCAQQPEPTLFHGSSSPEQDIFVLCVGECCADVRQIGGCRRRVRMKEDVAASSEPHEAVQLPAYLSP